MSTTKPPLVVTTKYRGVFFGYGEKSDSDKIRLENARMCVRWQGTKGVLGLAAAGPNKNCRISPAVPAITVSDVTAVLECSQEAAAEWEKGHWS